MWVAGVAGQGLGWMVTVFLYVLWTLRLLHNDLPDPAHRPGMYIAVGPAGQSIPHRFYVNLPQLTAQATRFKRSLPSAAQRRKPCQHIS